jgi:hypothetical protein
MVNDREPEMTDQAWTARCGPVGDRTSDEADKSRLPDLHRHPAASSPRCIVKGQRLPHCTRFRLARSRQPCEMAHVATPEVARKLLGLPRELLGLPRRRLGARRNEGGVMSEVHSETVAAAAGRPR